MKHLKNFKFITCFVLFGILFSPGIQGYDEFEIKQTFEKINLDISDLHKQFTESEKELLNNDIALSDRIKNNKETQENQTKSIETVLKEILKNQNSTETKLSSIDNKLNSNSIVLSDEPESLKQSRANPTNSIETVLKEILKNQNLADSKLSSLEKKQIEELNALDTKLSTAVETTENIVKNHANYALQQKQILDSTNENIKNFQAETKLQVDAQSETLKKMFSNIRKILKEITEMKSEQRAIKADITMLKSVQYSVADEAHKQTELKTDITMLKSMQNSVAVIVQEQTEIKTDLEDLKTGQNNFTVKLQEQTEIKTDLAHLKVGQNNLADKLQEIITEQNVTLELLELNREIKSDLGQLKMVAVILQANESNLVFSASKLKKFVRGTTNTTSVEDLPNNLNETDEKISNKIVNPLCANYTTVLKTCQDIKKNFKNCRSGVYLINPTSTKQTEVYCDMATTGGGWTVIQKRVGPQSDTDPRRSFFLNYTEYENGFGDPNDEYWIGLKNMAALTARGDSELRIELTSWVDNTRYAAYNTFMVGDSFSGYQLSIGKFSGYAEDSLSVHNNMKFTTKDKDQDNDNNRNCAVTFQGAWWYNKCHNSNLNGIHASFGRNGKVEHEKGIVWYNWRGWEYSFKKVTMMTRRKLYFQT